MQKYIKLFKIIKPIYKFIFIILIISPFIIYYFIHRTSINSNPTGKVISNFIEEDDKKIEEANMSPEAIVQRALRGEALPKDAPQDYKSDDQKFKEISKIRNRLADYFDINKKYPAALKEIYGAEQEQKLQSEGVFYNVVGINKDKYKLRVTFSTQEAVLVGANIKYENKNEYNLDLKYVIFTEMSGNFFNFTGSTINN